MVADEVAAADVDLDHRPSSPPARCSRRASSTRPLSRGALLDMTVLPLSYAGGERPAYNLTLMPGLVKNHDHAARLNESPVHGAPRGDDGRGRRHGARARLSRRRLRGQGEVHHLARRRRRVCRRAPPARPSSRCSRRPAPRSPRWPRRRSTTRCRPACSTRPTPRPRRSSPTASTSRSSCYTPPPVDVALWFMYQPLLINKRTFDDLNEEQQRGARWRRPRRPRRSTSRRPRRRTRSRCEDLRGGRRRDRGDVAGGVRSSGGTLPRRSSYTDIRRGDCRTGRSFWTWRSRSSDAPATSHAGEGSCAAARWRRVPKPSGCGARTAERRLNENRREPGPASAERPAWMTVPVDPPLGGASPRGPTSAASSRR